MPQAPPARDLIMLGALFERRSERPRGRFRGPSAWLCSAGAARDRAGWLTVVGRVAADVAMAERDRAGGHGRVEADVDDSAAGVRAVAGHLAVVQHQRRGWLPGEEDGVDDPAAEAARGA